VRRTLRKPKLTGSFVAYYRVSTQRQGESGLGLEAQRASVARYLSTVKGELVGEYTEVETGKRHGKRPELAAAITLAKRRQACLLIAKLDRLARNVHFISGLMEAAADFVAVDMPYANRLTIHIMAAMAEHEGEMISERTCAALAAAKARGTKLGNPNWQSALVKAWEARRRKPAPEEIAAILRTYRAEGLSLRQIAAKLNGLGFKTRTQAAWHPSSVRAALLSHP
jgi:DNA invertase Pin-like site-specific DNA recombinase